MNRQQALLQDETCKRFTRQSEEVLNVARAYTLTGSDLCKSQLRISERRQNLRLDRLQSSCAKPALPSDFRAITANSKAKRDEVENILCGPVIGSGIEPGPEPICGLDLVQEKIAQFAVRNGTSYPVFDVLTNVCKLPTRNSNAPSNAFCQLS